jgi:undecaprenyl-diphosphatase
VFVLDVEQIKWIQELRAPLLDSFFRFLNYFDRYEFFFILVPLIWIWYGARAGYKLFYILQFAGYSCNSLKNLFKMPRPYHVDPSVGLVEVQSYGFPSGGAMNAMLLSLIFLSVWKNPFKWPIAFVYFFLLSFSRLYLGVHFPIDIFGGWVLGSILFLIYQYIFPQIEKKLDTFKPVQLFIISQLVPLVFLFWESSKISFLMCAQAMGLAIGIALAYAYKVNISIPKTYKTFVSRGVLAIALLLAFYGATLLMPILKGTSMQFLLLGVWIAFMNPYLVKKIYG